MFIAIVAQINQPAHANNFAAMVGASAAVPSSALNVTTK